MPRSLIRRRPARRPPDARQGDLFAWAEATEAAARAPAAARCAGGDAAAELARAQITGDYARLARDLAGAAWPAIERIFAGDRMMVYLLTDAARRHVWHAWLAARPAARPPGPEDYPRLLEGADRALLAEACPAPAPGLRRALAKLGFAPAPARSYRALAALLAEDAATARRLGHLDRIAPALLDALAALRPETRPLVFACGAETAAESGPLLRELEALARRTAQKIDAAALAQAIRARRDDPLAPIRREIGRLRFPAPPRPAPLGARALDTPAALAHAARRHRNCIRDYEGRIRRGERYFYEWSGPPGAIVEARRGADGDWRLGEMLGPRNARLDAATARRIRAAFAAVGLAAGGDQVPF